MPELYLKPEQIRILRGENGNGGRMATIEKEEAQIEAEIYAILQQDEDKCRKIDQIIGRIRKGSLVIGLLERENWLNYKEEKAIRYLLYGILDLEEEKRNINNAMQLPDEKTLKKKVRDAKVDRITKAIDIEKQNPTDLSEVASTIKEKPKSFKHPYDKFCMLIHTLPFSLYPSDSRYVSLTSEELFDIKSVTRFNVDQSHKDKITGVDIAEELESWSDTYNVSKCFGTLIALQQHMEGNTEEYQKSIQKLESGKFPIHVSDEISMVATNIMQQRDPIKRMLELAKYYQEVCQRNCNYGIEADMALFIHTRHDRNVSTFPNTTIPCVTEIEKTAMQVSKPQFDQEFIASKYGITPQGVKHLLKQIEKEVESIGQ